MARYLVERYLPGLSVTGVRAALVRLSMAADELTSEGILVRHLGSTFIREEEACFCLFEGESPESVAATNERAAFPFARIVVVEDLGVRSSATDQPTGYESSPRCSRNTLKLIRGATTRHLARGRRSRAPETSPVHLRVLRVRRLSPSQNYDSPA